jgi:hypothetical protein
MWPLTQIARHHLRRVMHDPVDIRRRIERLVARVDRRDDYGQLLARGQVIHDVEGVPDVEAWRAEIRRQARADKIKVRTGFNEAIVWALLVRAGFPDALAAGRRYREMLARMVPLAVELRHEPVLALRDGDELVCRCGRCCALGFGDAAEDVVGGGLFEDGCPNEEPPKLTALAMMHVPSSRWP